MQRILMIMGVQRSGTNALFNSFSRGGDCIPMLDMDSSEVYESYDLRPETELRPILADQPKPVLLKPVNETKKRSIDAVFEEFHNYDLRILYIYRDPVNAFFSQTEMWPEYNDVASFIQQWNDRNLLAIHVAQEWKKRLGIVKYQDLSDDPDVFDQACNFFGIRGSYLFRADKNRGRAMLSPEIQKQIDEGTRAVMEEMDRSRTFLPRKSSLSFRKFYRNTRFFVIQQLRKLQLLAQ